MFFIILITIVISSTPSKTETPIHIISGVHFKEIPTVIPYISSTQLLYKFPYHSKSSLNLPTTTPVEPSCRNSLKNPNSFCTNQQYLDQIQNKINNIFNNNEANLNPQFKLNPNSNSRPKRAIDFIGDALSWCCNTATMTNLQDLSKNEQQVDDKMNNLLDYVKDEHEDLTLTQSKIDNFTKNIDHVLQQLHNSLQKYELNLEDDLNVTAKTIDLRFQQNNLQIMSYIYLAAHYSTLNKVEQDCQHNFIPEDLLTMEILNSDLQKLQQKLLTSNLTIALPTSKLFQLYSLPISKCHFEQDNIILQVKIPLIPTNTSYNTFSYLPIPLKWETHICTLVEHHFIVIKSDSSTFIVETNNNPDCNIQTSNLCLIPRVNSISTTASKCAKYLINGTDISELKNHCEFHCYPAPEHPIITQLQINKFLVTNSLEKLHISCKNSPQLTALPNITFGTVEVELPCHCQLLDEEQIFVSTITPCDSRDFDKPSIIHLVPLPWTNLDHLKINPFNTDRTEFLNITNYIIPTWNISVPTFSSPKLEKVALFDHIHLANTWSDIVDDRRIMLYILLVWCSFITILLLFSLYKIHILTIKLNLLPPKLPPRLTSASRGSMQDSSF